MKILCISDIHQKHDKLSITPCDVLIIAGDVCSSGDINEFELFTDWLISQSDKFNKALLVAGNHDFCFVRHRVLCLQILRQALGDKVVYLEDSEIVIDGVKFYGSPWQPEFNSWAFNLPRGERLKTVWSNIPRDVNVLITHGPPHGIGDRVNNVHAGCLDLFRRVLDLPDLFLHVFGHIHSGSGIYTSDAIRDVDFCNAAICTEQYEAKNCAYEFVVDVFNDVCFVTPNRVNIRVDYDQENK